MNSDIFSKLRFWRTLETQRWNWFSWILTLHENLTHGTRRFTSLLHKVFLNHFFSILLEKINWNNKPRNGSQTNLERCKSRGGLKHFRLIHKSSEEVRVFGFIFTTTMILWRVFRNLTKTSSQLVNASEDLVMEMSHYLFRFACEWSFITRQQP